MSLYHKYRPASLDEICGNEEMVAALRAIVGSPDKPHAYLFFGPTGCGKTTLGRILADMLGCKGQHDFREINTADFRGIDTIRDVIRQSQFKALESPVRVWLIDECHKLTGDAQNAMLKILEEPPEHVYFVLCTTELDKLLPTVRGRCSVFSVSLLSDNQMLRLLRRTAKAEGAQLEKQLYEQMIQDSLGHPRDALQTLEQVLRADPSERLRVARRTAETTSQTVELCRALVGMVGWKKVSSILSGLRNEEPEQLRRAVLGYCQSILLRGEDNERIGLVMEKFVDNFYDSGWPGLLFACYCVVKEK